LGVRRVITLAVVLVGVSALAACHTTINYAVLVPRPALDDNAGCFRQCQMFRGSGTPAYLDCVRTCPYSSVVERSKCEEMAPDPNYACLPERTKRFSGWKTFFLIGGIVLLVGAFGAAAQGASSE